MSENTNIALKIIVIVGIGTFVVLFLLSLAMKKVGKSLEGGHHMISKERRVSDCIVEIRAKVNDFRWRMGMDFVDLLEVRLHVLAELP